VYPDTDANTETYKNALPSLYFPLQAGPHRIVGHQSVYYSELLQHAVAYPTWPLSLSPGETIQRVIPAIRGPVSSVGKVLGNRTTLYKYLNPRFFVVFAELSSPSIADSGSDPGYIWSIRQTVVSYTALVSLRVREAVV
jgi:ER membrane protein complex subunit 1